MVILFDLTTHTCIDTRTQTIIFTYFFSSCSLFLNAENLGYMDDGEEHLGSLGGTGEDDTADGKYIRDV